MYNGFFSIAMEYVAFSVNLAYLEFKRNLNDSDIQTEKLFVLAVGNS
jgi:hypothetical protein